MAKIGLDNMMNQKVKWALVASLVLNMFLIGGLVGGAYKVMHNGVKNNPNALRFAADDLNAEQKKEFKQTLRAVRQSAWPLIQASGEARANALAQLAAPSFNKLAIENALARTREADRAVRIHMEAAVTNYAEKLNAVDRKKLAAGLAKAGPLRSPPLLLRNKAED